MREPRRKPLIPELRAELTALVAGLPEREVIQILGVSHEAYARARGALPIQRGTALLIENGMTRLRGRAAA
jgi:hypothetical protein